MEKQGVLPILVSGGRDRALGAPSSLEGRLGNPAKPLWGPGPRPTCGLPAGLRSGWELGLLAQHGSRWGAVVLANRGPPGREVWPLGPSAVRTPLPPGPALALLGAQEPSPSPASLSVLRPPSPRGRRLVLPTSRHPRGGDERGAGVGQAAPVSVVGLRAELRRPGGSPRHSPCAGRRRRGERAPAGAALGPGSGDARDATLLAAARADDCDPRGPARRLQGPGAGPGLFAPPPPRPRRKGPQLDADGPGARRAAPSPGGVASGCPSTHRWVRPRSWPGSAAGPPPEGPREARVAENRHGMLGSAAQTFLEELRSHL